MAVAEARSDSGKNWANLFRIPFFGGGGSSTPANDSNNSPAGQGLAPRTGIRQRAGSGRGQMGQPTGSAASGSRSVSAVAKSLIPRMRKLRLDPATKLYFPLATAAYRWRQDMKTREFHEQSMLGNYLEAPKEVSAKLSRNVDSNRDKTFLSHSFGLHGNMFVENLMARTVCMG